MAHHRAEPSAGERRGTSPVTHAASFRAGHGFRSSTGGYQLHHLFLVINIKKNQNPSQPRPRPALGPALPPCEDLAGPWAVWISRSG